MTSNVYFVLYKTIEQWVKYHSFRDYTENREKPHRSLLFNLIFRVPVCRLELLLLLIHFLLKVSSRVGYYCQICHSLCIPNFSKKLIVLSLLQLHVFTFFKEELFRNFYKYWTNTHCYCIILHIKHWYSPNWFWYDL